MIAPLYVPTLSVCHLDLNCSHLSRHNNSSLHTLMKTYVSQIPQWSEIISEVCSNLIFHNLIVKCSYKANA